MGMFEGLSRFFLSTVIALCFVLHGIVNVASSAVLVRMTTAATWQDRLDAPSDDTGPNLTAGIGLDCSSRKQVCHGEWLGPSEINPARSFHTDLPALVKSVPQINSWLPGVLQEPPRV
ncbi:hypothetical protein B5P45_17140 [Phyllobacterium zundukense]|uniref:Uncharacterized protein n=1 Tax=Phyllobacterium zundukense TaxID=1867719 RepID=A0A2N9VVW5_9HYPH|nr:hypothetical protein BLM14_06755 [Phyllobacterium zundukense]PIO43633.1 hypothetical protein B5P45_17140 [Phyllobacterium zundukense]